MDAREQGRVGIRKGLWRPRQIYPARRRDRASARSSEAARRQGVPAGRRLRARRDGHGAARFLRGERPRSPWSASTASAARRRSTRVDGSGAQAARRASSSASAAARPPTPPRSRLSPTGARIVIVPTIASTDAPCSAIAVRYTPDGVYQESISCARNPDIVLVDSALIAKAPARFLVAGIGDALSTWFEARSNLETASRQLHRRRLPGARGRHRASPGPATRC